MSTDRLAVTTDRESTNIDITSTNAKIKGDELHVCKPELILPGLVYLESRGRSKVREEVQRRPDKRYKDGLFPHAYKNTYM